MPNDTRARSAAEVTTLPDELQRAFDAHRRHTAVTVLRLVADLRRTNELYIELLALAGGDWASGEQPLLDQSGIADVWRLFEAIDDRDESFAFPEHIDRIESLAASVLASLSDDDQLDAVTAAVLLDRCSTIVERLDRVTDA